MRAVLVVFVLLAVGPSVVRAPREPHDFLRTAGGMSEGDLEALDGGRPVARVIETGRREIAVVGAVRIRGPRSRMIARYRDVSNLRKSSLVLQLGVFGRPARSEDLLPLEFEDYDLQAVRDCKPGTCGVRLSPAAMNRFHGSVTWESPDWAMQSAATWRQMLAELMETYQARGDGSLFVYHNREAPVSVAGELQALYLQSSYVTRMAPEPFRHVREFPRSPLAGAENVFYWSKDDFGLRPVLSLTHLVVYDPPAPAPALVATKQIYATHYFDAALGLTLAIDDGSGGFYMVSINRARTRSLTSRFRGVVRSIVQGRSRDALERILGSVKQAVENGPSPERE
ncbi:MAG TPA: hypothetical protein VD833_20365 [Vicinamibacterales bacterium]|nr:hypothetical protein [Vicinamibacterales bacterium]